MTRTTLIFLASLAAGCADTIDNAHEPDAAMPPGGAPPTPTGKVTTMQDNSTGTYTAVIDSTSTTDWTYTDFETGMEVMPTDAWDLRFQRFHISTNGGVSGTGGVEVAPLTGTTFDAVTSAPATGYLSDAADSNGDGLPEYAFEQGNGWYDYDPYTHALTPRPIIWVLKTDGGATLKLKLEKYYDTAGTSGWFTLHWGPL